MTNQYRTKYDNRYYRFIQKFGLEDNRVSRDVFKYGYKEGVKAYCNGFGEALGYNALYDTVKMQIWKVENN